MCDLLLELGVEEIPASHLRPAEEYIRASFTDLMREAKLEYGGLAVSSTPRRFFLIAREVQETQAETVVTKTGPAKGISFDAEGALLPAALGFLRKNNASEQDILVEKTEKGEFIAVKQVIPARRAVDIVADWVTALIPQLPFPKRMLWNDSKLALSRPLRWICAMWGTEVIPVGCAGIRSGNITFGNRYLGLDKKLEIQFPGQYLEALAWGRVLADRNERRLKLAAELDKVLAGSGLSVIQDERLIDTVTDLVEYPTAVVAGFEERFLALPEKIITSTISQNQKYFSVRDRDGRLSHRFVFISNGDEKWSELIRRGNEKVVKARLADAMWYFEEDTKHPLEHFLPRLEEVVFQARLGSMADKAGRILELSDQLSRMLDLGDPDRERVRRAALLCKADLVTTMLGEKEFTKLQGYIGKQYALACGEDHEVAEAIYEHYLPRGTEDSLPATVTGAVVAIADKLDTVCGIIGIGLLPTGSADPFALRRAANGVVQILVDREWELDLDALIGFALEQITAAIRMKEARPPDTAQAVANIRAFFLQRVNWMLKQLDLDYDVIDSLMHLSLASLPDLRRRAIALQSYKQREDFLKLVIGFKRAANIIGETDEFAELNPVLLTEPAERILHDRLQELRIQNKAALESFAYPAAIANLIAFGAYIDSFFDAVLVNCEDERLRANRHALLNEVRSEFLRMADISRIVIVFENENGDGK
jgi:glycyl-tRNA synthetase beta chain